MKIGIIHFIVLLLIRKCKAKFINKLRSLDLSDNVDPDMYRNVSELITSKGYPVEEHSVTTTDGYILALQRIPHGRDGSKAEIKKEVVFLQHGLVSAAHDFVINFPNQSLGFILADAGYDVWLGNSRGSTYGRKHVRYSPNGKIFWNFSFDEMAKYDLPETIDYILKRTGQKQLSYVGHSMGTTIAFALLSESKKYNDKIKIFIALAPVTTISYSTTPAVAFFPYEKLLHDMFSKYGYTEFLPNSPFIKFFSRYVCGDKAVVLCVELYYFLTGYDPAQLNSTRFSVYGTHSPAGTSIKTILHYAQVYKAKKFQKYDYYFQNYRHYHQRSPPEYDVSKITTPVALLWAENDIYADPKDVSMLQAKLRTVVDSYKVPFPAFTHADFMLAVDGKRLVHDEVVRMLKYQT